MKRRRLLAVGAASALLAGCVEDEAIPWSTDQNEPSQDDSRQSSQPASDSSAPDQSEPDNTAEKHELLQTYNDGIGELNSGIQSRENGVSAWNADNYNRADHEFSTAESRFRTARSTFRDAQELAYSVDNRDAQEFCAAAIENQGYMIEAMRTSQLMVSAAEADDPERANQHLSDVRDAENAADRVNVRESSTLESVLDLD